MQADTVLDPCSTTLRLALIRHAEPGTKVCVYENRLSVQHPSFLSRILRTVMSGYGHKGFSRMSVLYFKTPIELALRWYLSPKTEVIFQEAAKGLQWLSKQYDDNDQSSAAVRQLLESYQKTITQSVDNMSPPENRTAAYDDMKAITSWNERDIDIAVQMLNIAKEGSPGYIAALEKFIDAKEDAAIGKLRIHQTMQEDEGDAAPAPKRD